MEPLSLSNDPEYERALSRALRKLAVRDRSQWEISHDLKQRGFPSLVVENVIRRLLDLSLLDDKKFTASLVAREARRGKGPRSIAQTALRYGVKLDGAFVGPQLHSITIDALSYLNKKYPDWRSSPKSAKRGYNALKREGISLSSSLFREIAKLIQDRTPRKATNTK